jgi:vacuolar-type H+-ATPase subunit E/Vma4
VAKENLKMQRRLLTTKKQILILLIEGVEKRLISFVNSEKYEKFLLGEIEMGLKEIEDGGYII